MVFLISLIQFLVRAFSILIIVHVFLSYFLSPYHPIREAVDRIVRPFLDPIRKIMPRLGPIDFSPLVLIILVQLLGTILVNLLLATI
ncbi:MAG: YggT family protein [Chloroflexi bacterium]|jgi:YggT family protein|nr:MAG: YggT family protein [Chloroflexota bacterium]